MVLGPGKRDDDMKARYDTGKQRVVVHDGSTEHCLDWSSAEELRSSLTRAMDEYSEKYVRPTPSETTCNTE